MFTLHVRRSSPIHQLISTKDFTLSVDTQSPEEKVKVLILRDLLRLDWQMSLRSNRVSLAPPSSYSKDIIRASMEVKRQEQLRKHSRWLDAHHSIAQKSLAYGTDAIASNVEPVIEVCETQTQFDLFRMCRFYWSSPYSEYVGRRIKLLIRDAGLPYRPLIGIAALGSSIVHIPERDEWVGWSVETRCRNLVYTMDAYVLGALPPYNYLLGGKLISYILASNEIREIFSKKYKGKVTNISKRKANRLACVFTTQPLRKEFAIQ